jgi:hypothetical protein
MVIKRLGVINVVYYSEVCISSSPIIGVMEMSGEMKVHGKK